MRVGPKLELLTKDPPLRARRARNVGTGNITRNGKEIFALTLEKIDRGGGVKHGSPPLLQDTLMQRLSRSENDRNRHIGGSISADGSPSRTRTRRCVITRTHVAPAGMLRRQGHTHGRRQVSLRRWCRWSKSRPRLARRNIVSAAPHAVDALACELTRDAIEVGFALRREPGPIA